MLLVGCVKILIYQTFLFTDLWKGGRWMGNDVGQGLFLASLDDIHLPME